MCVEPVWEGRGRISFEGGGRGGRSRNEGGKEGKKGEGENSNADESRHLSGWLDNETKRNESYSAKYTTAKHKRSSCHVRVLEQQKLEGREK